MIIEDNVWHIGVVLLAKAAYVYPNRLCICLDIWCYQWLHVESLSVVTMVTVWNFSTGSMLERSRCSVREIFPSVMSEHVITRLANLSTLMALCWLKTETISSVLMRTLVTLWYENHQMKSRCHDTKLHQGFTDVVYPNIKPRGFLKVTMKIVNRSLFGNEKSYSLIAESEKLFDLRWLEMCSLHRTGNITIISPCT